MRRKAGEKIFWLLLLFLTLVIGAAGSADEGLTQPTSPSTAERNSVMDDDAEEIPSLTESVLPSLTRIAVSLIVIVAIIYLTVFMLRKLSGSRFGGGKGKTIEIVEQTYLAPKKSVCLLKLADRAVLVGITEQNINMLTEFNWDDLPKQAPVQTGQMPNGFQGLLNEAAGKLFGNRAKKRVGHESTV